MSEPRDLIFQQVMETHRAAIASQIAHQTREFGLVPADVEPSVLEALVDSNLSVWFDAIDAREFSALEETTVAWCSMVASRGGDVPGALQMIELTGQLLLDAALGAMDDGVDDADDGARRVLQAWSLAKGCYDRAFRAVYDQAAERALILRDVAEKSPIGIGIATPSGDFTYMNEAHLGMLGYGADEAIGKNIADILAPQERQLIPAGKSPQPSREVREGILRVMRSDGTILRTHTTTFWVFSRENEPLARCAFVRDLTEEEKADEERKALEQQIVETQARAIREMGAPLLPISDRIVVLPLVGTIDDAWAARIIEEMLLGITQTEAGHVIVDITGVPRMTADVAELIVRAAKAAELVGSEMVLTGIRGDVAKTLLGLGISFEGIETQSTLRAGVAHAMAHERAKLRAEKGRR